MPNYFEIAKNIEAETTTDEQREELKSFICGLVKYPCKIACKPNDGSIDIYVFSEKKKKVTDWLELQPSGAIGAIFDLYPDPDADSVSRVDIACEKYNDSISVTFEESDDGSSDSSDSGSGSSGSVSESSDEEEGNKASE
jgi:hypothetical protein